MKRSGFQIMARLIGLVKPLAGFMILAITMGLIGHLCAAFITVCGGYAILNVLNAQPTTILFSAVLIFALVRGFLRYSEQACNHFIAFKLLALIRDKVFGALRRLCPAKLEGKDKANMKKRRRCSVKSARAMIGVPISICCAAWCTAEPADAPCSGRSTPR